MPEVVDAPMLSKDNEEFWWKKCQYCKQRIEQIMQEVGVPKDQAVALWSALLIENASIVIHNGFAKHSKVQEELRPLFERMVKISEDELKKNNDGEEWRGDK